MRALLILLSVAALLACGSATENGKAESYIKETHPNGLTKLEWRYSGQDSLNRTQVEYHNSGNVFITGKIIEGERSGEWKSFHPNGQPWSIQHYVSGDRTGETKNWFENGQLRYEGQYERDERTGTWIFFTTEGDTALTRDF